MLGRKSKLGVGITMSSDRIAAWAMCPRPSLRDGALLRLSLRSSLRNTPRQHEDISVKLARQMDQIWGEVQSAFIYSFRLVQKIGAGHAQAASRLGRPQPEAPRHRPGDRSARDHRQLDDPLASATMLSTQQLDVSSTTCFLYTLVHFEYHCVKCIRVLDKGLLRFGEDYDSSK